MTKLVLIRPGAVSDWVRLQDAMRESHEAQQKDRADDIEGRKKNGIPLDDETDWHAVGAAVAKKDSAEVARLTSGHALLPLPDYVDVSAYDDVSVVFRAISEAQRRTLALALSAAQDAVKAAAKLDDVGALDAACAKRDDAYAAFVKAAVARVDVGGEALGPLKDDDVEALRITDLLQPLYVAARDFQRLSPGKGKRFGSLPQST
jgi:hypothetical protein